MDTRKFGAYLSGLRKQFDFTQSQVADALNVSRQAVSKWETGDSLPDIALLPRLAELYRVTIDQLLRYGERRPSEGSMMRHLLAGQPEHVSAMLRTSELGADSIVHIAPLLQASTLGMIADGLAQQGIGIRQLASLAVYMNEPEWTRLLEAAQLSTLDRAILETIAPFLNEAAKETIFLKLVNQELDGSLLSVLLPYLDRNKYGSLIEAAVLEGQLHPDILRLLEMEQDR